ncbi:hypothetical protein [Sinomonas sp. P47F7]|uniref:hypothetical protein n=1 Tax=Sinomonas sp. P47F7 TaxID=3410987 RepID=UPI003BF5D598
MSAGGWRDGAAGGDECACGFYIEWSGIDPEGDAAARRIFDEHEATCDGSGLVSEVEDPVVPDDGADPLDLLTIRLEIRIVKVVDDTERRRCAHGRHFHARWKPVALADVPDEEDLVVFGKRASKSRFNSDQDVVRNRDFPAGRPAQEQTSHQVSPSVVGAPVPARVGGAPEPTEGEPAAEDPDDPSARAFRALDALGETLSAVRSQAQTKDAPSRGNG